MTVPRSSTDDMASAAWRHLHAAKALIADWPDEAWYIAGYGPECARKASLTDERLWRLMGHEAGDAALLGWLLSLDARAVQVPETATGWRPDVRYARTNTRTLAQAEAMVVDCWRDAGPILAGLWARGAWSGSGELL